jgi:hypothetical protein
LYFTRLIPWVHRRLREKTWYRKMVSDMEKADAMFSVGNTRNLILVLAVCLVFLFSGLHLGLAIGTKENIAAGDAKPNHTLLLSDGSEKPVYLVGQNSAYLFFVSPGHKKLTAMPIDGNIKAIKKRIKKTKN